MPTPELETIDERTLLRRVDARRGGWDSSVLPKRSEAIHDLLQRIDAQSAPLSFGLASPLPIVGPAITAFKRVLRRLMRTYLTRQSAFNEFLLEMSRLLAVEQERRLSLVESRLTHMEQSLLSLAAQQQLLHKPSAIGDLLQRADVVAATHVFVARKVGDAIGDWESLTVPWSESQDAGASSPCICPPDVFRADGDPLAPLLSLFADRRFVLAAGCGSGNFLTLLRESGVKSTGVSYCPACGDKTRGRGGNVMACNIVDYLVSRPKEKTLDGLVCANLLEHRAPAEIVRLLSLANKAMSIGSLLVIATSSLVATTGPDHVPDPPYPLDVLVPLVRVSGFDVHGPAS